MPAWTIACHWSEALHGTRSKTNKKLFESNSWNTKLLVLPSLQLLLQIMVFTCQIWHSKLMNIWRVFGAEKSLWGSVGSSSAKLWRSGTLFRWIVLLSRYLLTIVLQLLFTFAWIQSLCKRGRMSLSTRWQLSNIWRNLSLTGYSLYKCIL